MKSMPNGYSRRQVCYGLLATASLFSALALPSCQTAVMNARATDITQDWILGIGADPYRFLGEVKNNTTVRAIAKAWAPQFLSAWLNSYDNQRGHLRDWDNLYHTGQLAAWFNQGFTIHVITWENDQQRPTGNYHISDQYLRDIDTLARYVRQANVHHKPTYWTLATEFSYWRVPADTYNATTAPYYQALMQNLQQARTIIKTYLPNAWVAPSWGGWVSTFDDPTTGSGRSMIDPFGDFMQSMDGVAFQSMRPHRTGEVNSYENRPDVGNPAQILQCCRVFSRYHRSLMVSHYEPSLKEAHPDGGRADTVAHDFLLMMRRNWLQEVHQLGLNKFSLMHYGLYKGDPYGALTAAETFQRTVRQNL